MKKPLRNLARTLARLVLLAGGVLLLLVLALSVVSHPSEARVDTVTLTLLKSDGGSTTPVAGYRYYYSSKAYVNLTAASEFPYVFAHWWEDGKTLSKDETIKVRMYKDRTIIALFYSGLSSEYPTPLEGEDIDGGQ